MFESGDLPGSDNEPFRLDQKGEDLAGKYLITKIVHSFNLDTQNGSLPGRNIMTMTLMKDGLPK